MIRYGREGDARVDARILGTCEEKNRKKEKVAELVPVCTIGGTASENLTRSPSTRRVEVLAIWAIR